MVKQREAIDKPVRMCSNKEAGVAHFALILAEASADSKQGTTLSTSFGMAGFWGKLQISKQLDGTAMRYCASTHRE
jgi:hypothetical protein